MEKLTGKGSPQQRPTFHSNYSIPFSPKPRHPREPHITSHLRSPAAITKDHRLRRLPDDICTLDAAGRYLSEGRSGRQKKGLVFDGAGAPTSRTPTASSEATWRRKLRFLTDSPARSVAIAAKASLDKQRKAISSVSPPWPLGGSCPCTRRKSVEVKERCSAPRCSKHLDFNGIGSVSLKKREAKAAPAGEEPENRVSAAAVCGGDKAVAAVEPELGLAAEEMAKLRLVAESWTRGQDPFLGSSGHLLCHERFHCVMPFSDGPRTVAVPVRVPSCGNPPDDPPRDSLEVFQPVGEASATPRGSVDFRWRVTRSAFPGDVGPRRNSDFRRIPVARVASQEDELASDSSSDLFEIESFSTQATPSRPAYPRGSPLDGAATTPRAAKMPAGSPSGRVSAGSRPPWRADGCAGAVGPLRSCWCEEGRSVREQLHQNHAKQGSILATAPAPASASDGPAPLLAPSHGSASPSCHPHVTGCTQTQRP